MDALISILCGSAGAAIATGVFSLVLYRVKRRDEADDKKDVTQKALRYLMLYIIQERCKEYIAAGEITLDERRSIHHWHDVYHNGLGGNGDADALLNQVDALPLITD